MLKRLILLAILLVLPAIQAHAVEEKEKPELRCYDVRDLTNAVVDYPAPLSLLKLSPQDGVATNPFDNAAPKVAPTLTNIAEIIRVRIKPDSWDPALGTSIEERGGLLVVMQTKEVHTLISLLLTNLRTDIKPQVVVKGLLAASAELPRETYFDKAALQKLLGKKAFAQALAAPRIVCFNTQRTHITSGREFTYIKDFDVSGTVYDPLISVGLEGYIFDVCPILSADRRSVQVELQFVYNSNVNLKERSGMTLASPIQASREATAVADKPKADARNKNNIRLAVNTLTADVRSVQSQVSCPAGQWTLAGSMTNPESNAAEKFLLFFVSAEATDQPPMASAPAPEVPHKVSAEPRKATNGF
jgi:hypothetical protein